VNVVLQIFGSIGLLVVVYALRLGRHAVRLTTLISAWRWLAAASVLWFSTWFITTFDPLFDPSIVDQLWYAVAVLMLCPLVAVLGARRPISRAWTWFVLIPLLLVFSIPLVTIWSSGYPFPRLEIETPFALGYMLVLVMGTGNYFGTRYTLASMLLAAAMLLIAISCSTFSPLIWFTAEKARMWATALFGAAALAAVWAGRAANVSGRSFDRLWLDFRDYFGIVWAKRVQDRINQTAQTERWPARLELHGLTPIGERAGEEKQATDDEIEHAFRWLFRRFAEAAWIDARLGLPAQNDETAKHDA
jgi:hypothetical protein